MKNHLISRLIYTCGILLFLSWFQINPAYSQPKSAIKNVVLVHGAFADRAGWEKVYRILTAKGYHVVMPQLPLTSLAEDVTALNLALDKLDGPAILVGHSWSGTVITQAGMHEKVAALVYIAAFEPAEGENSFQWVSSAPAAPESGLLAPDDKGYVYYDKAKFHAGFCAELSAADAAFMADDQQPIKGAAFGDKVTIAAWKTKPSFAIVTANDKSINPVIQRNMYNRAHTPFIEINSCHVAFLSHSKEVADYIMASAQKAVKN